MKSNRTSVSLGALLSLLLPLLVSAQMVWTCVTDSAQWSPRFGHQLIVFHDTMWLFCGFNSGQPVNDVWYSTDGDSWICATPSAQWSPRSGRPGVFIFDDKIWLTGGFHYVGYWTGLDDVWWSSDGINWILATDSAGWAPRGIHTALVLHDTMWVIGGVNNTSVGPFYNDVWQSADGVSWGCVTDSAPWSARGGHTTVILRDTVWLIGGYGCNDIWCSGDGRNWTFAGLAPWGFRYGHTSVVLRDTIWSMAGYFHNDVWYSTDGMNWLMAVEHAEWGSRHFPVSAAYANTIWLTGGTNNYWSGLNDVWNSTGLGVEEGENVETHATVRFPTIFHGPLRLPEGKTCKVFDITGRVVEPGNITRGIYFIEIDNTIVRKVIKIR